MTKWYPIETAPKDEAVLVFVPAFIFFNDMTLIMENENGLWLYQGHNARTELNPTHWMPLPKPPEDKPSDYERLITATKGYLDRNFPIEPPEEV